MRHLWTWQWTSFGRRISCGWLLTGWVPRWKRPPSLIMRCRSSSARGFLRSDSSWIPSWGHTSRHYFWSFGRSETGCNIWRDRKSLSGLLIYCNKDIISIYKLTYHILGNGYQQHQRNIQVPSSFMLALSVDPLKEWCFV